jgi:hypothetical protein
MFIATVTSVLSIARNTCTKTAIAEAATMLIPLITTFSCTNT